MNFSAFVPPSSVITAAYGKASSAVYAIISPSSAPVPEIDGALIPQVGLLIGGLYVLFGRKKQKIVPTLTL